MNQGGWFRLIIIFGATLLRLVNGPPVRGEEFPKSQYRVDFASRGQIDRYWQEMTPLDKKMLRTLDEISQNVGCPQNFSKIRECLVNTDSSVVLLQALQAIACGPSPPNDLVVEASKLASCTDSQIKLTVGHFLGWFARPEVFPAVLRLLFDDDLSVVQMAHSTLPRFGVESLAALPFIPEVERFLPETQLGPVKSQLKSHLSVSRLVVTPNFKIFLGKTIAFCIAFSSIGTGAFVGYSPPSVERDRFRFTCVPPPNMLPPSSNSLDLPLPKPPQTALGQTLHYRDAGLRLPVDQNPGIRSIDFQNLPLKDVFDTFESFSKIRIIISPGLNRLVSAKFENTTVEGILNELIASFSLNFTWLGNSLVISPSGQ